MADSDPARIPIKIADCFLLSLDSFMRKSGQGGHFSQSVLEVSSCPDLEQIRSAVQRLTQKHPLLCAHLRRDWKTWLPYWQPMPAAQRPPLPLGLWRERSSNAFSGAQEIEEAASFLENQLTHEPDENGLPFNARLDIVAKSDGHFLVALTWSHRVMDGKGAELLLTEIARLCEGVDEPCESEEIARSKTTLLQRRKASRPLLCRFDELAALGVHSLGGPQPQRGPCRFQLLTLNEADSESIRSRARELCGPLFSLPYYLAAATRAHAAVFHQRGKNPGGYISGVPVQTRKRGARGPLFHNQVSVFFFCCKREDAGSMEAATAALKRQFSEMMREKLDEAFTALLEMMMRMPVWLFMRIVRWQFKGEINSFFYSHTGVFAPELNSIAGAKIENAWHLPNLGRPPGTGIFFNERNDKITMTLSWREGCLSAEERQLMTTQILADLLGAPKPDLVHAM